MFDSEKLHTEMVSTSSFMKFPWNGWLRFFEFSELLSQKG